jgi:hypothetical protein
MLYGSHLLAGRVNPERLIVFGDFNTPNKDESSLYNDTLETAVLKYQNG